MKYIIAILLLITIQGCNDILDILPDDKPTLDDVFKDRHNSEKYLFTCYDFMPPEGNPMNSLGLTGGGDVMYYDEDRTTSLPGGPPPPMQAFFQGNDPTNPYMNYWDGSNGAPWNLWRGIRRCNIFLDKILVENGGPRDLDDLERARWIAEVKAIRAYMHFYLFRLYGPIPIMKYEIPISAKDQEIQVYRNPVDEVVEFIVNEIDEAVEGLPSFMDLDPSTEYGRFTKTIALSIKAKTLVLAASPLFNNNNYYQGIKDNRGVELFPAGDSEARWEAALAACDSACRSAEVDGAAILVSMDAGQNAIIGTHPGNINDTTNAMISIRQAFTESWNSEIIWAVNSNTTTLQRFATMLSDREWFNAQGASAGGMGQRHGPTLNVVEMFYSSNGIPIDEDKDWETKGWYLDRYKTQLPDEEHSKYFIKTGEETALLHFNRSLRFYASVGFDGGLWEGRLKSLANTSHCSFLAGKGCGAKSYGAYGNFAPPGYLAKKLSHLKTTYAESQLSLKAEQYSFPLIRITDMYLLLAECLNEAGGPEKTDSQGKNAYYYLDEIRSRVGMEGVVESWSKYALNEYKRKPSDVNGLRDIIRQERLNELAFEGSFYYDVRRWLIAENLFNKPVLGWNMKGENKQDFYNLTLLAQPRFTMKDYLMPIKISSILQNPNLVQNPGW